MVIQVIKNISYIKRNTSQVLNEFSMSIVLIAYYGNICATRFGRFHFKCYTNQAVIADDITSQAFTMFSFVVRTTSISVCDLSVTLVGSLTICVNYDNFHPQP